MNNSDIAPKIPDNYDPLKDEMYMSPYMLLYFQNKLETMLDEILRKEKEILDINTQESQKEADHVDQGIIEELRFQELALQKHEEEQKKEIIKALKKTKNGSYGYCEETGKPIEAKRLLSVPTASYTVEAQRRIEEE